MIYTPFYSALEQFNVFYKEEKKFTSNSIEGQAKNIIALRKELAEQKQFLLGATVQCVIGISALIFAGMVSPFFKLLLVAIICCTALQCIASGYSIFNKTTSVDKAEKTCIRMLLTAVEGKQSEKVKSLITPIFGEKFHTLSMDARKLITQPFNTGLEALRDYSVFDQGTLELFYRFLSNMKVDVLNLGKEFTPQFIQSQGPAEKYIKDIQTTLKDPSNLKCLNLIAEIHVLNSENAQEVRRIIRKHINLFWT